MSRLLDFGPGGTHLTELASHEKKRASRCFSAFSLRLLKFKKDNMGGREREGNIGFKIVAFIS